jgi:DNA-binding transcriptional LysR family regulator
MALQLRQLQHAVTLAEEGSFSAAARRLHLSQPALSRSIQSLEEMLGAVLFDRGSGGVTPTAIGRILVERGRALISGASAVEREVQLALGLEIGTLNVGAAPYPANISVGRACGLMLRDHPGLRLDVRVGDWTLLQQMVLDGTLDVAVAELSVAAQDSLLETETLPRHRGYFICNVEHPLMREPDLTLEKIQEFPLVAPSLPERLASLRGVHRVDTFRLVREIVGTSDAIGMATASQVASDERGGLLRRLPLNLPWLHTNYGFVRLRGRTPSPAALAFMASVREVEAALAADAPGDERSPPDELT